jgi:hypothetical protein
MARLAALGVLSREVVDGGCSGSSVGSLRTEGVGELGQFLGGWAAGIGVVYDEELAIGTGEQESFVTQLQPPHLRMVYL